MSRILVIGASESISPIIEYCKQLGDEVIAVDYNKNSPGFKIADKSFIISIYDKESILELAKKEKVDGVLTLSEYPTETIGYVCEKLNLNGPSIKASGLAKNKYLLREALYKNGFKTPKFKLINKTIDLEEINDFPIVIKPVDSSLSMGVTRINTKSDLLENYIISKKYSKSGKVIVEDYIEGKEYSVEALTQNRKTHIVAITEKTIAKSHTNSFVEERHILPANISKKQESNIFKTITSIHETLEINNSATHTELRINNKGEIYIIEIAVRLGGGFITSDLIPLALGIDMFRNIRNLAIGEPINTYSTKQLYAGIQYFTSPNYFDAMKYENLAIEKGILVKSEKKEFENKSLNNSLDRLGHFMFVSNSYSEINELFK